jgi:phosphatidylserine synthase
MFVLLSETRFPSEMFQLGHGPVGVFFIIGVLVMISLQVSNVRYPKPTKVKGIFFLGIILVIALFTPYHNISPIAALILVVLGVLYVLFGPLFVSIKEKI